jgi:hypothetical protein
MALNYNRWYAEGGNTLADILQEDFKKEVLEATELVFVDFWKNT